MSENLPDEKITLDEKDHPTTEGSEESKALQIKKLGYTPLSPQVQTVKPSGVKELLSTRTQQPAVTYPPTEPIPSFEDIPDIKRRVVHYQMEIIAATTIFYTSARLRMDKLFGEVESRRLCDQALETIDQTFTVLLIDFEEGKVADQTIEHLIAELLEIGGKLIEGEKIEEEVLMPWGLPGLPQRRFSSIQDFANALEQAIPPQFKTGKSLLAIHPTIAEDIASFLEEAVKEIPDIATLQRWSREILLSILKYNYGWPLDYKDVQDVQRKGFKQYGRIYDSVAFLLAHAMSIGKPLALPLRESKQEWLKALYHELVKLNSSGILSAERMRKLGEAIQGIQAPRPTETPPGVRLWSAIQPIVTRPAQPGSRPLPTQESLILLETFLTTSKSMSQLAKEGSRIRTPGGVRHNLNTSLKQVWEDIPQEARQGYQSPEEALQAVIASPMKTEETRRKMRENERPSWKEEKPRQTGKHSQKGITGMRGKVGEGKGNRTGEQTGGRGKPRDFSPDHHTHLSQAASGRWRRHRVDKAQGDGSTSSSAIPTPRNTQ